MTAHNTLTGLANDDHPQYPLKTGWDPELSQSRDKVAFGFYYPTRTATVYVMDSSFEFWVEGVKYTKTTNQTTVISDTSGLWYFYFDNTGTLQSSQTPWDIADNDKALVATVYWNTDQDLPVHITNELHSWRMDASTHARLDEAEGLTYGSGLTLYDMEVDQDGSSVNHARVSVAEGYFYDADIKHTAKDEPGIALMSPFEVDHRYRSGSAGLWAIHDFGGFFDAIPHTANGRAQWNEYTGSTWQLTEAANGYFVLLHLIATNATLDTPHLRSVVGLASYATKELATAGAEVEMAALRDGPLDALGGKSFPVATLIYQTHSDYSNNCKSRIVSTSTGADYINWLPGTDQPSSGTTYNNSECDKVLTVNEVLYVRTTGNDLNDGLSANTAFLTPSRAVEEAKKYSPGSYYLYIDVGEGTFNCSTSLDPGAHQGSHIVWVGEASEYTSQTINNIDASTANLSTGLEYIDFDVSLPADSGAAVGMFLLIKGTSGGTNPNLVKGCHEIVAYSANVATVRCVRVAGSTTLPSGTITGTSVVLVKTVLNFNNNTAGIYTSGEVHAGNWDSMVFKGTLVGTGIWILKGAKIALGTSFGTSKWHTNLNCQYNSSIQADYSVHSYSDSYLVSLSSAGALSLRYATLSGGGGIGARAYGSSYLNLQGATVICAGLSHSVQSFRGGYVDALSSIVEGCVPSTSIAFYVASGGGIDSYGATDDAATSRSQAAGSGGAGSYHTY
jgi:hypothetical protein